ncbi:hypothetical protein Hanom_Chr10g00947741 [Helianthus anomalus]
MPYMCHPLHQYPFLGHPHRLQPRITIALPQPTSPTNIDHHHFAPNRCRRHKHRPFEARSFICSSTKTQAIFPFEIRAPTPTLEHGFRLKLVLYPSGGRVYID